MKKIIAFLLLSCATFGIGCGGKTEQKFGTIAFAGRDRAVIDLGNMNDIKNGDQVLVVREAHLTHPVNGKEMGIVKEEIGVTVNEYYENFDGGGGWNYLSVLIHSLKKNVTNMSQVPISVGKWVF